MTGKVWAFFLGFVVLSGMVGAWISPETNAGFADGAAVLAFVTLVAVGIERMIEVCWTLLGQNQQFGGWWPLNQIATSVASVEQETNNLLVSAFKEVKTSLESAKTTLEQGTNAFKDVEDKLTEIEMAQSYLGARLKAARELAPGSSRFAITTHVAADAARVFGGAATLVGDGARVATQAVDKAAQAVSIATTIVSSFGDNPARRIASILLGAGAGMLVAGFMGLNLFRAVLGQDAGLAVGVVGVLLTGIVMGLGSSPTHEVIKALKNYKESRTQPDIAALAPISLIGPRDFLGASKGAFGLRGGDFNAITGDSRSRVLRLRDDVDSVPIRSTD